MAQEKGTAGGTVNVVFMGTPAFARDILAGLLDCPGIRIPCVYTQPDRPAGRGKKLLPPPVKVLAEEHGLCVRQPLSFRSEEELATLQALAPDFLVVAAYGMILPQAVLDVPKYAPINVHTSLLPAYRGCAPVQRAIMDGVETTGVSIMRMEAGLDTGPVYDSMPLATAGETAGSLLDKMAVAAGPLLVSVLERLVAGTCEPKAQEGPTSYAAKILKAEGHVDVFRPVAVVDCHVRGVTPDPGAHVTLELADRGTFPLVLEEVCPVCSADLPAEPGLVVTERNDLYITCLGGALKVLRLKPQGKKSMDAAAFLNGQRLARGPRSVSGRVVACEGRGA